MPEQSARVLVIDDDPDILDAMSLVLDSAGYQVSTATNGKEALERLRAGTAPSVILLDLMMPVMNGWQFRAEQTQDPKLAAIPVVIITGAGETFEKTTLPGVDAYLQKPVSLARLLSTVKRFQAPDSSPPEN